MSDSNLNIGRNHLEDDLWAWQPQESSYWTMTLKFWEGEDWPELATRVSPFFDVESQIYLPTWMIPGILKRR